MKRLLVACVLFVACSTPVVTPSPSPTPAPAPSPSPTPEPSPTPTSPSALELPGPGTELAPGRYTRSGRPVITFEVGEGWTTQQAVGGFFDIQQDSGSPDVIAIQFLTEALRAEGGRSIAAAIAQRDNLAVSALEEVALGGIGGVRITVETRDPSDTDPPIFTPVMDTSVGPLSIASGRRLQVNLFDIHMGTFAVLVGGSIARWDRTLEVAQPVLDSLEFANFGL